MPHLGFPADWIRYEVLRRPLPQVLSAASRHWTQETWWHWHRKWAPCKRKEQNPMKIGYAECNNQPVELGSHSKESGIRRSLQEFSNPKSRNTMRDGYTPERQQSTSRLRSRDEEL
jgi:hypothetical protein